jgi:hypothetical protein
VTFATSSRSQTGDMHLIGPTNFELGRHRLARRVEFARYPSRFFRPHWVKGHRNGFQRVAAATFKNAMFIAFSAGSIRCSDLRASHLSQRGFSVGNS